MSDEGTEQGAEEHGAEKHSAEEHDAEEFLRFRMSPSSSGMLGTWN